MEIRPLDQQRSLDCAPRGCDIPGRPIAAAAAVCVCVWQLMCSSESDLVGERRAHFHRPGGLPGPRDQWRVGEDLTAAFGMSLSEAGCSTLGVRTEMAAQWFHGVELPLTESPPVVILPDYPSVAEDRQRAAVELDRLAKLGKIHWYKEGSHPPDLRVCPSHLIIKGDKVRAVRDWSCARYPLNAMLVNPPVEYGAMDDFLGMLTPGAYMGGGWICRTAFCIGWWPPSIAVCWG